MLWNRSPRLRVERLDLAALRGSDRATRWRAAERIFRCWQPLFAHLADQDPTFHLRKHVDDPRPVMLRAYFAVDAGRDRSLVITRFHRVRSEGRWIGTFTIHAGVRAPDRTRDFSPWYARDALEFSIRYRDTRLYFAEILTHPAVYLTVRRVFAGLEPGPEAALDPSLAPVVRQAVSLHGAEAVDGGVGGLCRTSMASAYAPGEEARWRARAATDRDAAWFLDRVRPGFGQVVVAPLAGRFLLGTLANVVAVTGRRLVGREDGR